MLLQWVIYFMFVSKGDCKVRALIAPQTIYRLLNVWVVRRVPKALEDWLGIEASWKGA